MTTDRGAHWADLPEKGFAVGIRLLAGIYSLAGRRVLNVVMLPVVLYFFLTNGVGRRASRQYLERLHAFDPAGIPTGSFATFRHFMSFASSLVDRFGAWMGKIHLDDLDLAGHEELMRLIESGTGVILVGAHVGSLEVSRALSRLRPDIRLNVIHHTLNATRFNQVLRSASDDAHVELIEATTVGPALAQQFQRKLAKGELIVTMGDRVPIAGHRTSTIRFLGHPAEFPQGPFLMAALFGCPIYTLFCVKRGRRYLLAVEELAASVHLDRRDRDGSLEQYMEIFVRRLEDYCRATPLQWFNFFPFWGDTPT